ncbi:hypothetical protein NP233_g5138 [Leucocoprinus birnbaumii]|uniref:Uncharacterized protein n=1 Tax=Leucocoprinus birnbaumii TaxID=56174 RepID=A0AAD5VVR0_9AGAR|nr:hypothetical protein NP233_g5138 [Leucocoprinus birnbaumii]
MNPDPASWLAVLMIRYYGPLIGRARHRRLYHLFFLLAPLQPFIGERGKRSSNNAKKTYIHTVFCSPYFSPITPGQSIVVVNVRVIYNAHPLPVAMEAKSLLSSLLALPLTLPTLYLEKEGSIHSLESRNARQIIARAAAYDVHPPSSLDSLPHVSKPPKHLRDILISFVVLGGLSLPFKLGYYQAIWGSPGSDTLHSLSTIALTLFYMLQCVGTLWDLVFDPSVQCCNRSSFCPDKDRSQQWAFIFGVTPWKRRFRSEGYKMEVSRGSIAICCLIFIGLLAFYSLVVQSAYMLSTFHSTLYKTYWGPALNAQNTAMNFMLELDCLVLWYRYTGKPRAISEPLPLEYHSVVAFGSEVGGIRTLLPDPFPLPPLGNQTASLRLVLSPTQPQVLTQKESPENSVVDGFATLGGIWTFVNGIFAAVFGTSLLLVLFNIKPLSVYGLVHLFSPDERNSEADDPRLSLKQQAHIISLLKEHLLDADGPGGRQGTVDEERTTKGSDAAVSEIVTARLGGVKENC